MNPLNTPTPPACTSSKRAGASVKTLKLLKITAKTVPIAFKLKTTVSV
jgi:hypothetical protein